MIPDWHDKHVIFKVKSYYFRITEFIVHNRSKFYNREFLHTRAADITLSSGIYKTARAFIKLVIVRNPLSRLSKFLIYSHKQDFKIAVNDLWFKNVEVVKIKCSKQTFSFLLNVKKNTFYQLWCFWHSWKCLSEI